MKKLTATKAKTILTDKSVKGHPLTSKQKKFFGAIAGGAKPYKQRKSISIPKKELVEEHKELINKLKSGKGLKQEAEKQSKELKQYKKKRPSVEDKYMDGTKMLYNQTEGDTQNAIKKLRRGMKGYAR